jgi:hypothetical protein
VVSIAVTASRVLGRVEVEPWHARRRLRKDERRRLERQDGLGVRLVELHHIRALLQDTVILVNVGWIQNAWLAVLDAQGRERRLTAYDLHLMTDRPVTGACLVGGIVYAAGGPSQVHSQLVQRTLDLTWHTLYEGTRRQVRWCPSPPVRAAHVRDLTRWNDHPQRTVRQVSALLEAAVETADVQIGLRRAQQSAAQPV